MSLKQRATAQWSRLYTQAGSIDRCCYAETGRTRVVTAHSEAFVMLASLVRVVRSAVAAAAAAVTAAVCSVSQSLV
jgi:hypothetical protein